jgi:hypothetical protein
VTGGGGCHCRVRSRSCSRCGSVVRGAGAGAAEEEGGWVVALVVVVPCTCLTGESGGGGVPSESVEAGTEAERCSRRKERVASTFLRMQAMARVSSRCCTRKISGVVCVWCWGMYGERRDKGEGWECDAVSTCPLWLLVDQQIIPPPHTLSTDRPTARQTNRSIDFPLLAHAPEP